MSGSKTGPGESSRNPLVAAGSVVTDGSDWKLILLLALMGAATVVVGGTAAYLRRR